MTQREYGGATKEYLQLDFAGDDKIFLPADQIGRITRYSGGPAPTVSKLGGTDWERTKQLRRRSMDRLVCGDVGYGKTEVALRAAFKAVQDGKQVAILVPTTVLAQQHL